MRLSSSETGRRKERRRSASARVIMITAGFEQVGRCVLGGVDCKLVSDGCDSEREKNGGVEDTGNNDDLV